jgi:hypothetical protein
MENILGLIVYAAYCISARFFLYLLLKKYLNKKPDIVSYLIVFILLTVPLIFLARIITKKDLKSIYENI